MIVKQTRPPGHSTKQQRASEWQANGKMERKVATEIRIYNWKMSADIRISRIDSFHTAIKTKYKEIKVQAQAQTVSHGDLPPETVNPELSAGLFGIVTYRPDITGIDKHGCMQFPKKECTVFRVHVKFYVTRLINEVDAPVAS